MFQTRDGLVRIDIAEKLSEVAFPASDFSIINLPYDKKEASELFTNLYNSPSSKHVSLVLIRQKKSDKLKTMGNFDSIGDWAYLDSVHLWYEKASSSSNNGFLPVSEQGVLVHKGSAPDVKKTSWFSDNQEFSNATTLWNLASQENEEISSTYYQRFCWELPMLLMSMMRPLENNRFIYGLPIREDAHNIFKFCRQYNISVQLYVRTTKEASELLEKYKEIK